jgi:uncharacterized protein (UPF0332 family)
MNPLKKDNNDRRDKTQEAISRVERAKSALVEAKLWFRLNRYKESAIKLHQAVYHSARALLIIKNLDFSEDYSKIIKLFGLHYIQSGIMKKEKIKPALVFADLASKKLNLDKSFILEAIKSANYLVKVSKKLIKNIKKNI